MNIQGWSNVPPALLEVWAKEEDVWFDREEEDVALDLIFPTSELLAVADREDALRIKRLHVMWGLVRRLELCLEESDDATYSEQEPREKREAIPFLFRELARRRALLIEGHEMIGFGCRFEEEILPRLAEWVEQDAPAGGEKVSGTDI